MIEELKNVIADLETSSRHTFYNLLDRFAAMLSSEAPIGRLLDSTLPIVAFPKWYSEARDSIGSMVGSGSLNWPVGRDYRVALQLQLFREFAKGNIDVDRFMVDFLYAGRTYQENINSFIEQLFTPFHRDLFRVLKEHLKGSQSSSPGKKTGDAEYLIDPQRIRELKELECRYDLARLVRLCEELNQCYGKSCYLAVASLTRALIDHVPPVFGVGSFAEVANNYSGGSKSFKDLMGYLNNSARKIGDAHLHTQLRSKENLPTKTQVNFSNSLDMLLSEIIRICQ